MPNKKYSLVVALVLAVLEPGMASLPWSRWSWSAPQQPIEYFFRRTDRHVPIKSPEFVCRCPPQKECVVEFKINEDMPEFLHIRGLLDNEKYSKLKEDFDLLQFKRDKKLNGRRKQSYDSLETDCCCPPRNVMMPSFITDSKFDEINGRFSGQNSNTV